MSQSSACDEDNDCMICLFPLLGESHHHGHEHEDEAPRAARNRIRFGRFGRTGSTPSSINQGQVEQDNADNGDIGAVFPCGHVFHIKCWKQYGKEKCPICNQTAPLFSRIFISAPASSTGIAAVAKTGDLSNSERLELERYRRQAREQLDTSNSTSLSINSKQDRMLLRDMEKQVEEDPQGAKMMMTMMMMVQSRDLRKAERELELSREECASTKEILKLVQSELEDALGELDKSKPKMESLQEQVNRLRKERREAATNRSHEYKKQIKDLQEKLDRAKEKLALKNKQLSRRNKEIIAKRKLVHDARIQLETTGRESQKVCQKTKEELQRTKKELELLRELDSFTLNDSFSTYGHGSFNESLTWNDLNLSP